MFQIHGIPRNVRPLELNGIARLLLVCIILHKKNMAVLFLIPQAITLFLRKRRLRVYSILLIRLETIRNKNFHGSIEIYK